MLTISEKWMRAYPDSHVGILAMDGVANLDRHPGLDRQKAELEADLRALFKDQAELKDLPTIRAYRNYYKRFKKSYHVLQQLESVVFKGKSIPRVSTLVEAMFMEELRNMLLTAGHDLHVVAAPLTLDAATGDEKYVRINGQEQVVKAGDMIIADAEGVISSIIYGPDRRTAIGPSTTAALFTVYGVPGIGEQAVLQHLQGIEANVKLVSPQASTSHLKVYSAV